MSKRSAAAAGIATPISSSDRLSTALPLEVQNALLNFFTTRDAVSIRPVAREACKAVSEHRMSGTMARGSADCSRGGEQVFPRAAVVNLSGRTTIDDLGAWVGLKKVHLCEVHATLNPLALARLAT